MLACISPSTLLILEINFKYLHGKVVLRLLLLYSHSIPRRANEGTRGGDLHPILSF